MALQAEIAEYTGTEVISLDEARDYLRVDHTDDNAFITELIKVARMQVLNDTNTAVVETHVGEYFQKWPSDGVFTLRYSGVLSNVSVVIYDQNNSLVIIPSSDYITTSFSGMPKIEMKNMPSVYDRLDAIVLGYKVTPFNDDSKRTLKMAMYLLISHFYDNRSAVTYGNPKELPIGYQRIINQYKNYMWK